MAAYTGDVIGSLIDLKDEETHREFIGGGVVKITQVIKTNPIARTGGAILSLGLSEIFSKHREEVVRYYYHDILVGNDRYEARRYAKRKADECFENGQYKEARDWYNAEYYTCPSGSSEEKICKEFLQNSEAEVLNQNANHKFDLEDYREAEKLYKKARETCSENYQGRKNFMNRYLISSAHHTFQKGLDYLNQEQFEDALDKFKKAYKICPYEYKNAYIFKKYKKNCQAELLNEKGSQFLEEGNYADAEKMFSNAAQMSSDDYSRAAVFSKNCKKAKKLIDKHNKAHKVGVKIKTIINDSNSEDSSEFYNQENNNHEQTLEVFLKKTRSLFYNGVGIFFHFLLVTKDAIQYNVSTFCYETKECVSSDSFLTSLETAGSILYKSMDIFFQTLLLAKDAVQYTASTSYYKTKEFVSSDFFLVSLETAGSILNKSMNFLFQALLLAKDAIQYTVSTSYYKTKEFASSEFFIDSLRNTGSVLYKATCIFFKSILLAKDAAQYSVSTCYHKAEEYFAKMQKAVSRKTQQSFIGSLQNATSDLCFQFLWKAKDLTKRAINNYWKKALHSSSTGREQPSKIKVKQNESDGEKFKVQEALRLNEEGLKLYNDGKLKESLHMLEDALSKYDEALKKFRKATALKILDIFFNSFMKVIIAFVRNEAYDDAESAIADARSFFPQKAMILDKFQKIIDDGCTSTTSFDRYLKELEAAQTNIGADIIQLSEAFS